MSSHAPRLNLTLNPKLNTPCKECAHAPSMCVHTGGEERGAEGLIVQASNGKARARSVPGPPLGRAPLARICGITVAGRCSRRESREGREESAQEQKRATAAAAEGGGWRRERAWEAPLPVESMPGPSTAPHWDGGRRQRRSDRERSDEFKG